MLPDAPKRHRTAWVRIRKSAARHDGDILISHELFSRATAEQAAAAIDALEQAADQVELVVTIRDLARQMPSAWQQRIKQGGASTFDAFFGDPSRRAKFNRLHDLRELLGRWQHTLPDEHVHLVTVPPAGRPHVQLWERYAEAVGASAVDVDLDLPRSNTSLGRVELEVLRRANAVLPRAQVTVTQQVMFRDKLANKVLAASATREPLRLPAHHHAAAQQHARDVDAFLRTRRYTVHGDLGDLLVPDYAETDTPTVSDPVPEADVARAAVGALKPAMLAARERARHRSRDKSRDDVAPSLDPAEGRSG